MSQDTTTPATGAGPEVIEAGRYKLSAAPDGGLVLARAAGTCARCQECGCGQQAALVSVPAMVLKLAQSGGGLARLRGMLGIGGGDE